MKIFFGKISAKIWPPVSEVLDSLVCIWAYRNGMAICTCTIDVKNVVYVFIIFIKNAFLTFLFFGTFFIL